MVATNGSASSSCDLNPFQHRFKNPNLLWSHLLPKKSHRSCDGSKDQVSLLSSKSMVALEWESRELEWTTRVAAWLSAFRPSVLPPRSSPQRTSLAQPLKGKKGHAKNMVFQSSCSSSLFKMDNSVHVRMYVCTYVRMYVCTYVRMYVWTYARMHVCTYVRMYVCTYVRMYVCTYVRMHVCTYVRMYVCRYVSMYVCTYARMDAYMHVCMYALLPNTKRRPRPLPWIINTCRHVQ